MKMFQVRFFYFLRRDLCRACPEVSETGFGSKIGQRGPENEFKPLKTWSANQAVAHEELFMAKVTMEELSAPFFVMRENLSRKMGAEIEKDLTVNLRITLFCFLY